MFIKMGFFKLEILKKLKPCGIHYFILVKLNVRIDMSTIVFHDLSYFFYRFNISV